MHSISVNDLHSETEEDDEPKVDINTIIVPNKYLCIFDSNLVYIAMSSVPNSGLGVFAAAPISTVIYIETHPSPRYRRSPTSPRLA